MEERKDLLQKTFHEVTPEEIDRKINEFGIDNKIKFTQTHVNYYLDSKTQIMVKVYDYIVFYLPKTRNKEEKQEMMGCPGCGAEIPKNFEFHMKCGWKKNE